MKPEESRVDTWDPRTAEPAGFIPDPGTYDSLGDNAGLVPTALPESEIPGVAGQTWEGRRWPWRKFAFARTSIWSALLWGLAISTIGRVSVSGALPRPVALVLLALITVAVVVDVIVSAWRYRTGTLTIDAAGVRIRKRGVDRAIAFRDIASVAHVRAKWARRFGVTSYIRIQPRPEYCARTGTRPPGRLSMTWVMPTQGFTPTQLSEILAALKQGVSRAGGQYVSDEPEPVPSPGETWTNP